jgi:hypothetical protein
MNIRRVRTELFHAHRQTDMTNLTGSFRNSAKSRSKNAFILHREQCVHITKTNHLMLFREMIAFCCKSDKKPLNTLCGEKVEMFNVTASGTCRLALGFRLFSRTEW